MYLELIGVDLDDPASIRGFVDIYGELGMRHGRAVSKRTFLAGFKLFSGQEVISNSLWEGRKAATTAAGLPEGAGETLDEFRWGVRCMRDLVSAWRVIQGELDPAAHHWEAPIWRLQGSLDEVPWEGRGAVTILESGLGDALEAFPPAIIANPDVPVFDDHWPFEIACLELFNHIVENAIYRRCENETCGRFFVRQRGRAEHGQYRTRGVKYCSAECAKQTAQRAYRRRKAQQGAPAVHP